MRKRKRILRPLHNFYCELCGQEAERRQMRSFTGSFANKCALPTHPMEFTFAQLCVECYNEFYNTKQLLEAQEI